MGTRDKARNTTQKVKGEVTEGLGKFIGDARLRAKGKADQAKANAKQTAEKVKDTFKR
jgi:uncharacterized protein YjbJ (UPF0337 family)